MSLRQVVQVFLNQFLDDFDDVQAPVFHETDQGPVNPVQVLDAHDEYDADEDRTDGGDGERLEKGTIALPMSLLPDDGFVGLHGPPDPVANLAVILC